MADENATTTETKDEVVTEKDKGGALPAGTVAKEEFEKVMAELHKFKSKAKEYEDKVKKVDEDRLRETQDWKKLADLKTQEAEEVKQENQKIKKSLIEDKKYSAV